MAEEKRKPGRPPGSKNKKKPEEKTNTTKKNTVNIDHRVKDDIWAIVIMALGAFLVMAFQTKIAGAAGAGLSDFFKGCFGAVAFALPYYLILYGILLITRKVVRIGGRSVAFLCLFFFLAAIINSARFLDPHNLDYSLSVLSSYYTTGIQLKSGGIVGMFIGCLLVKAIGIPGLYIFSFVGIIICILLIINTPVSRFFESAKEKRRLKREGMEEEELPPPVEPKTKKRKAEKDDGGVQQKMDFTSAASQPQEKGPIDPYSTSYVPGKISSGQKNILEYMQDDNLFGAESEENHSYGIDGISEQPSQGFGVEPPTGLEASEPAPDVSEIPGSPVVAEKPKKMTSSQAAKETLAQDEINTKPAAAGNYKFPPMELLNKGAASKQRGREANLNAKAMKLEETLQNFNIDARIINVTQGPAVTRYEIQPNVGVKVKSITNLADDIALNLEARSIRIEAPIPGKAAVGIEVENDRVTMVTIREILDSSEFKMSKSKISFAVGKDISGKAIVADLKAMPHLLIAGSTGSGKSVCINSIITSILYKANPDEVKLVLIDPKVVELANYNGIPHLLIPVVTEPSKAAAALNWAVTEMDERYKKFAEEGVRELESYNKTVRKSKEEDKVLPQIVIIIDELADLMMAAPSQVEESICRLAQKARAAGMHLIVATQRPSVDVITGVIKANIPSRIAFAVSSQFDSRTILDMAGAEKLVGKGDMLFNPMGGGKPTRVQGTFISDSEVHNVIEFVKEQVEETEYADHVMDTIERADMPKSNDDTDELLQDAIETVVSAGQASVSMLQRRFRIGYNRAARIIDMMEARGIVGPSEGSKPRQVLMSETELYAIQQDTEDMKVEE